MQNSPFNNSIFQSTWLQYFKENATTFSFDSIEKLKFFRSRVPSLYVNVGKNITNGNYYVINTGSSDYKGKVFLVYDVPTYFDVETELVANVKVDKIPQYKGFSSQLKGFESFDDYFNAQFKSKSRYKYRRNITRLEACFDVDYKMYHGEISKEEYDFVCKYLKQNLSRRFDSLGLDNDIISKWDYYYDLMYKMILSKEGVLSVIYCNGIPVGISFSFLTDKILLFAITSIDIDYYRYNLGHTTIIKLMQWCFENGYNVYDFSKGEYIYKDRWTNHSYDYCCHIIYDSKSLKSKIVAKTISNYFSFKQYLRDKNVNRLYYKLRYIFKSEKTQQQSDRYKVNKIDTTEIPDSLSEQIDIYAEEHRQVRVELFDFLYGSSEKVKQLKIYKSNDEFFVIGEKNTLKLVKV